MTKKIVILIAIACACVHSLPMFAWGQEGHRIIAKIAYDHLSRKACKSIDSIMGKRGMLYWANWPDEIKSDTIYPTSHDWHYQDFDGGMSDSQVADALVHYPKEGGNLFRALDSLVAVAKAGKADVYTLRFIIHLSGDRYCPMHTAHMDDKGGNAVRMAWFSKNQNTNLHAVWDTKLIESQGYSYTEYAQMIEDTYAGQRKSIEQMTDSQLLVNNYHFTESIYRYQETWDGNTYHYIYRWHQPMEQQLYIAGIRLAKLLNEIYK
ncbi:MAG: S1/P1 nuclease [Paludibacteraceae bacterium]|nr:S1/P1 nuclease [Paludibacteraceae bacterium]